MKQFRHKLSNTICEWNESLLVYQGRSGKFLNFYIPQIVVESGSDWEEIPEGFTYWNYDKFGVHYSKSKPEPVVTLQGKDIFAGDIFYSVTDDWKVLYSNASEETRSLKYLTTRCFSTPELADQFIRDNKPVVPWGLIAKVLEYEDHLPPGLIYAIDKIKKFRP